MIRYSHSIPKVETLTKAILEAPEELNCSSRHLLSGLKALFLASSATPLLYGLCVCRGSSLLQARENAASCLK